MGEVIINEEWRSIDGYLNYQVSNIGRVRNSKTGRILKPAYSNTYLAVPLGKDGKYTSTNIHRLVANEFVENLDNKPFVDHIDGNRENNIYTNLRWATHSENGMNCTKKKNTSSIYKGVSFNRRLHKWSAQIKLNKKNIFIGYFMDETEAAKVYDEKAMELFGEYAKLNFPDDE